MAETYKEMTKVDELTNTPNSGAVYHETVVVPDSQESLDFIIPVNRIYDISAKIISGTGNIQFTNDRTSKIKDESADFQIVDVTDPINLAYTGFKVVSTSGEVTAKITVKTSNA